MMTARRYLHHLRYALVNNYYNEQKLQITSSQIEDEVAAQSEPRAHAEVSSTLRDSQPNIHPSVRKLLGKQNVNLEEIFRSRAPRNKSRVNYSAMVQSKNKTISADTTKTLRPSLEEPIKTEEEEPGSSGIDCKPKKVPRHLDPKVDNVVTLDGVTRNKQKHRYRFIIGNTSKWAPGASRCDRSTHQWLLYVRGAARADAARVLRAVAVRLHPSYAPHHHVRLHQPPFQVSRRGWGEFSARVTLEFALPHCNRPATLAHTIKLDRNYTGLQTLGAETIVDVWLYSTPEMLEFEYKDDPAEPVVKVEKPIDEPIKEIKREPEEVLESDERQPDEWLNFFTDDTTEVNVDEMFVKNVTQVKDIKEEIVEAAAKSEGAVDAEVAGEQPVGNGEREHIEHTAEIGPSEKCDDGGKRIVKYMDPNTGKIYYLEMDRALDLNKIQEIVINSQERGRAAKASPSRTNGLRFVRKKKGASSLKPERESLPENVVVGSQFDHIRNDHCYLANDWCVRAADEPQPEEAPAKDSLGELRACLARLACPRVAVAFLLKKIPLVHAEVRDPGAQAAFPFVVEDEETYWNLDFAKRRNIEWSRAKVINRLLGERFDAEPDKVWRTKQILMFSRLHGYHPLRPEGARAEPERTEAPDWSSWDDLDSSRRTETNIRELYPGAADVCSLTAFERDDHAAQSSDTLDLCDSDDELDVTGAAVRARGPPQAPDGAPGAAVLPASGADGPLFLYIEKACADIGVELRNEDVGHGYSYSAVHAVLLSAMKCFAEEMLRAGMADQLSFSNDPRLPTIWSGWESGVVRVGHVYRGLCTTRLRCVAGTYRGVAGVQPQAL